MAEGRPEPIVEDVWVPRPVIFCIPVGEIEKRWEELDLASEIVVYCRSGVRSATAAVKLAKLGFKRVKNLTGGILNWPYGVIK